MCRWQRLPDPIIAAIRSRICERNKSHLDRSASLGDLSAYAINLRPLPRPYQIPCWLGANGGGSLHCVGKHQFFRRLYLVGEQRFIDR